VGQKEREQQLIIEFLEARHKNGKQGATEDEVDYMIHLHDSIIQLKAMQSLLEEGMIAVVKQTEDGSDFILKVVEDEPIHISP